MIKSVSPELSALYGKLAGTHDIAHLHTRREGPLCVCLRDWPCPVYRQAMEVAALIRTRIDQLSAARAAMSEPTRENLIVVDAPAPSRRVSATQARANAARQWSYRLYYGPRNRLHDWRARRALAHEARRKARQRQDEIADAAIRDALRSVDPAAGVTDTRTREQRRQAAYAIMDAGQVQRR